MANTTDTLVIYNGNRRYVVRYLNIYVDALENPELKLDISTLTGPNGKAPTKVVIEEIEWAIQGYNYVTLYWDADTDDEIATLTGTGYKNYVAVGGLQDPRSDGATGDILTVTNGAVVGNSYDITLSLRLKD